MCCCYGGGSKWEQSKALEGGAEIVVATPGRMIDLVKMKATNLTRVSFLVLDEADRMFDMGFGKNHCQKRDEQSLQITTRVVSVFVTHSLNERKHNSLLIKESSCYRSNYRSRTTSAFYMQPR